MAIFFFGFVTSYQVLESQRILVDKRARANDIAMTNLSKVTTRPAALTQSVCNSNASNMDLTTGNPATEPGLDITQYGYTLESTSSVQAALGPGASQTLVAYAPSGCANFDTNPVKIVATVSYGADKVTHATYVQ